MEEIEVCAFCEEVTEDVYETKLTWAKKDLNSRQLEMKICDECFAELFGYIRGELKKRTY
jgi:hypothetical protein